MAKRKKKNYRLRKSVRRTLGALFMISAIIIAAIPFPDAAAEDGTTSSENNGQMSSTQLPSLNYNENAAPAEVNKGIDLTNASDKETKKAYTLLYMDNSWWYEWQFEFYTLGNSNEAIISTYNGGYKTKNIKLNGTINTGYEYILKSEVDAYFAEAKDGKPAGEGSIPFVIDKTNYSDWYLNKYFPDECETIKKAVNLDPNTTETSAPLSWASQDSSIQLEYYCEKFFDSNLKGKGYTLEVAYASADITQSGSGNVNDEILIPHEKTKDSGDPAGTGYTEDDNGFLYKLTDSYKLKGIGNNAFQNVQNVDTLDMSEQIQYIGDYAFQNSWVKEVVIANVVELGNYAFKDCNQLSLFTAGAPLSVIGTGAFQTTVLTSITLPSTIKTIGYGAFAKNSQLSNITFSGGSGITIEDYAFFECPALTSQDLSGIEIIKIGEGAFALAERMDERSACTSFVFPSTITREENFEDLILAGRDKLKEVTMPACLGRDATRTVTLPLGTFKGCTGLSTVTFPESCKYLAFDAAFFSTVENPDFYVTGPAILSSSADTPAYPRASTWKSSIANGDAIPYMYQINNENFYEVSNGEYILLIDDQGVLNSCNFLVDANGSPIVGKIEDLIIPDKVGNKVVTSIATGCFGDKSDSDSVLNNMLKLTVEDGSTIAEISDNVFEGAAILAEVDLGDSIKGIGNNSFANISTLKKVTIGENIENIGSGAFQNCPFLTDITFDTPSSLDTLKRSNIGENAFSTKSNYLVVTGPIGENYGPFVWAMDPSNYVNKDYGVRVCYKTGDPSNLTVILDNKNNLPTLMDYPKYEDLANRMVDVLDSENKPTGEKISLKEKYERNLGLTPAETQIVNATLFLDIPAGIRSIDTKGYFAIPTNSSGDVVSNSMNARIYFSGENGLEYPYRDAYENYGLFNGVISDDNLTENEVRGDDNLLRVTMHTVEYLPTISNAELAEYGEEDYTGGAFYSCENLQSVDLGSAMKDIGSMPFLDCLELTDVVTENTANYTDEKGIIYETVTGYVDADGNPVNGKKIIEVLHTRGMNGDADVNTSVDTKLSEVVEIAPGAFMNTNIGTVDLTGTPKALSVIPEDCFKENNGLNEVILPDNIRVISNGSFENTGENIRVTIKGKEVDVQNDAFKGNKVIVWTYKNSAAYNAASNIPGVTVKDLGNTYRVVFYNSVTGEIIKTDYVEEGKSADAPVGDEIPEVSGMKFKGWNTKDFEKVMEDLTVLALYESDGSDPNKPDDPTNPEDPSDPSVPGNTGDKLYTLTVTNGSGSGKYPAGTVVTINAGAAPAGSGFAYWSSTNQNIIFNDATDTTTTLAMPAQDTTIVCNFTGYYRLDVEYGSGSGSYPAGAKITIEAVDAPQGRSFASWKTSTTELKIENARKQTTTVTMPKGDAKVTATYMDNGTLSGNSTSKNNTSIMITKPGISNTHTASAYVSGSTDNFIVKISESLDAADEVQKALQKKYPDMSRIKYFAMDISLYDAKGINKITDTSNLKVNITIPIPDALREYAGNNRVGAVVNGELETLNPKFTTINGVPSVTFTATHFSPYTIYVDTGNLTVSAGTLDSTPKTGDGIHPKWFLSIGLACISIILFTKKDRRYVKVYR